MRIIFDIGGTKMRIARSRDEKSFEGLKIIPTPKNFDEGMEVFKKSILEIARGEKITAAAGGIAGPLDQAKTMLVNSPNIAGWIKKPLKKELEKALNAPVFLENDSALAGLGEALYGSGKKKNIVAYLTVSTGVGGVRIERGKISENALGFEPGFQIIDSGEKNIEARISGSGLEKRYKKRPEEINSSAVWEEEARLLARGVNDTIVYWSPDVVVLGGSLMKKISIGRVRFHLKKIFKAFPKIPLVKKASLGDLGGLYGALAYLNQQAE